MQYSQVMNDPKAEIYLHNVHEQIKSRGRALGSLEPGQSSETKGPQRTVNTQPLPL